MDLGVIVSQKAVILFFFLLAVPSGSDHGVLVPFLCLFSIIYANSIVSIIVTLLISGFLD
jgi:hypothetical protein